jgi:hypothetical protein
VGVQNLSEERALATEQPERHGQIKRGSFLADVSGSEVDGYRLLRGKIEAAIPERRADALAALLYGKVRQADDVEIALEAWANVYLDLDEVGVDSKDRSAESLEEHPKNRSRP